MKFNTTIYYFRILAFLEGLSYVMLLFIAVPLKYILNNEILVQILGMPHGVLFILYVTACLLLKHQLKWQNKKTFIILISSIIPFGFFYIDYKYFK